MPPGTRRLTDAHLVDCARRSDRAALELLLSRHRGAVLTLARRLGLARDEAEDLAQDTFVQAVRALDQLRDPSRFLPWLLRIARRRGVRRREVLRLTAELPPGELMGFPAGREDDLLDAVQRALPRLPARQRRILDLHYLQGYTCDEIARALGLAPGSVKRLLHESRNRLREECGAMEPDAQPRGGPRRLVHWINGSTGPGPTTVFSLMKPRLAQSICLSLSKTPRTPAETAMDVCAHEAYVLEHLEALAHEGILERLTGDRYRAAFLALDAADQAHVAALARQAGPALADAVEPDLETLRSAYLKTPVAAGHPWQEAIWLVVGVFLCNVAVARNTPDPTPHPPERPSGGRYWLGGFEQVPGAEPLWTTGFNAHHNPALPNGQFWTNGLYRHYGCFTGENAEVLRAIADGAGSIRAVADTCGISRTDAGRRVQRLTDLGFIVRRGRALATGFPVYTRADSDLLVPVLNRLASHLWQTALAPRLAGLDDLLRARRYGHLASQFPVARDNLRCDLCGEGLRVLMERGVLPRPDEPAPWGFAFLGWIPDLPLMDWG